MRYGLEGRQSELCWRVSVSRRHPDQSCVQYIRWSLPGVEVHGRVVLNLLVLKTRQVDSLRTFYQALGIDIVEERHGQGTVHHAGLVGDCVDAAGPRAAVTPPAGTTWEQRAVVRDPDGCGSALPAVTLSGRDRPADMRHTRHAVHLDGAGIEVDGAGILAKLVIGCWPKQDVPCSIVSCPYSWSRRFSSRENASPTPTSEPTSLSHLDTANLCIFIVPSARRIRIPTTTTRTVTTTTPTTRTITRTRPRTSRPRHKTTTTTPFTFRCRCCWAARPPAFPGRFGGLFALVSMVGTVGIPLTATALPLPLTHPPPLLLGQHCPIYLRTLTLRRAPPRSTR